MRGRHLRTLLLTALITIGMLSVPASVRALSHSEQSLVRFAHFAPEPATGDIYVLHVDNRVRMNDVPYGAVTDYLELKPGTYTFKLRNARAPANANSEHEVEIRLGPGSIKTIYMYGPHPQVWSAVVDDVLKRPAPGATRMRVVNALSERTPVDLVTAGGTVLARGVQPGAASPYLELPAGTQDLAVRDPAGTVLARAENLPLRSGESLSLAANGGGGKPRTLVALPESAAALPAGRMDMGAGGTADELGTRSTSPATPPAAHSVTHPAVATLTAAIGLVGVLAIAKVVTLGTLRRLEPGRRTPARRHAARRS